MSLKNCICINLKPSGFHESYDQFLMDALNLYRHIHHDYMFQKLLLTHIWFIAPNISWIWKFDDLLLAQLEKVIGDSANQVDWRRSLYLNMIAHTSYTLTVAICRYVFIIWKWSVYAYPNLLRIFVICSRRREALQNRNRSGSPQLGPLYQVSRFWPCRHCFFVFVYF